MEQAAPYARSFWRFTATLRLLLLTLLALVAAPCLAQEAVIFALQGDGAATAVIDRAAAKAWITDGGRNGSLGVREARIGNQDLLDYLLAQGIRDVAITCSHPHSDHMGGLEELVRDPRILRFASLYFVDNGDAKKTSLYQQYLARWTSVGHAQEVSYSNATNAEVFGHSKFGSADVKVRNFSYDASKVGATDHDKSVIMQYTLPGEPPPQTVVDFDDASTGLVEEWAHSPGAYASILIHPHHGSPNNSIEAILREKDKIGLKDVVIPVNRNNRYLHPSPTTLLKLVQELGPDHVYITDSDLGENVVVTHNAISDSKSVELHRERLRSFVSAQRERYSARIRQAMQEDHGNAEKIMAAWTASRNNGKDLTPYPGSGRDRRLWQWLDGVRAYDHALDIIDHPRRSALLTLVSGYKLWPHSDDDPMPPESAPDGPTGNSPGGQPKGPSGGTDSFFAKEAEASGDGAVQSRLDRFRAEIARPRPLFGGIVLGNQVQGPSVTGSFEFLAEPGIDEQAQARPIIRVRTAKGAFDFVGLTSSELWAAYNIVSPTGTLAARYPGRKIDSPALVGLNCDENNACTVALHPAIAGTLIGWDAIYADNSMSAAHDIATKKSSGQLPGAFTDIKWGDFSYHALQWFDTPSVVSFRNGSIAVKTATNGECLLQIRISNFDEKKYIDDSAILIENAVKQRVGANLASRVIDYASEHMEKLPKLDSSFEARMAAAQIIARRGSDDKAWYDALVRKIQTSEESYWKTSVWPTDQIQRPCAEYPPLAAVNRLAKAIALLKWRQNSSGGQLPALPDWVRPVWAATSDKVQISRDPYFSLMKK